MKIDDPSYPLAGSLTDVVLPGYRPKAGSPGVNETLRVPASLFTGALWEFQGILSTDGAAIHVYSGTAYKGSITLIDLEQPDL